jgi:hypothetical protein
MHNSIQFLHQQPNQNEGINSLATEACTYVRTYVGGYVRTYVSLTWVKGAVPPPWKINAGSFDRTTPATSFVLCTSPATQRCFHWIRPPVGASSGPCRSYPQKKPCKSYARRRPTGPTGDPWEPLERRCPREPFRARRQVALSCPTRACQC